MNLIAQAERYHDQLPARIREYLNQRGIPNVLIDHHLLGWNGKRITIPVFNRQGELAFFKLAKDPDSRPGPKMLVSPGAYAELYGWELILARPCKVIICEGEFDRLVLEANGFHAVTSTAGAATFRAEWAREFEPIPETCICFDRDEAGRRGALRVARLIPHALIVELPEGVGSGGDVTDFFVRLGRTREEFQELVRQAKPAPKPLPLKHDPLSSVIVPGPRDRIEQLKTAVPIEAVIGQYVGLQKSGERFIGLCPFHEERRPSFTVFPVTKTFFCFGCSAHGDVISFLQQVENLTFSQALEALEQFNPNHEPKP